MIRLPMSRRRLARSLGKSNGLKKTISSEPASRPNKAKAENNFEAIRRAKLHEARNAEVKLMQAMADNPGLSIVALANAAEASRSTTQARLQRLCEAGKVEKDRGGRWKLKEERPSDPPRPPPS